MNALVLETRLPQFAGHVKKVGFSSSSSSENGVLIISSTKLEDAGTYFCRAANKFGAKIKAALVTLNVEKGII